MDVISHAVLIGVGATIVMDLWGVARAALFGAPAPDYAKVGRWLGHMARGRFRHDSIAKAEPMAGELAVGWLFHYLTGVCFSVLLLGFAGPEWLQHPTLAPALGIGLATVAFPVLLMQPAMGLGMAARQTPRPNAARMQSVLNHAAFGLGLYASGWFLQFILA